jgi:hypothetical protein
VLAARVNVNALHATTDKRIFFLLRILSFSTTVFSPHYRAQHGYN